MPAIFGPSSIEPRKKVLIDRNDPAKFNALFQHWFDHPLVDGVGSFDLLGKDRYKVRGTLRLMDRPATLTFTIDEPGAITGLQINESHQTLADQVEEVISHRASRELGLSFALRPQPETLEWRTRPGSKGKPSGESGSPDDSSGRQGEALFNDYIRQALPDADVIWLNAREESRAPYDFRINGSVLVDVKATRHRASVVYGSEEEQRLAEQKDLFVAVVRLVPKDVTIYWARDDSLRPMPWDHFAEVISRT